MKKLLIFLLGFFALMVGCAHYTELQKTEVSNSLIKELSRDLAEFNIIVKNARKEFEKEQAEVNVIEAWTATPGLKFEITTPSEKKVFDVIAKSKIDVPLEKGFATAEVFKAKSAKGMFIGVGSPKALGVDPFRTFQVGVTKQAIVGGYPVKFYDAALAKDPKSFNAIKKYVSFTSKLEKVAKEIMDRLVLLKKKYEKTPVYVDGFSVGFPFGVQIQFKLK